MTDGSHITRLGGVKQEIQDLKSGLESSINEVKVIIDGKFSEINSQLKDIKESLASTINDIVTKSILKVKDSIIEALKEENIKLQIKKKKKCENLEARLFDSRKASKRQDQHTRRNNLKMHGIPVDVKDEQLEQKVTDIFSNLNINIFKPGIEDCHRLGKSNTTIRFVNCKVCKDALEKKFEVNRLSDISKLDFKRENKLFISENLTPYNQRLTWVCRELKRAKKIHNSWSNKGIIKFRRTMNLNDQYLLTMSLRQKPYIQTFFQR